MQIPPSSPSPPTPPVRERATGVASAAEAKRAGAAAPHVQAPPGGWRFALTTLKTWAHGLLRRAFGAESAPAPREPRGPHYGPTNFLLGANLPWVAYGQDFGASKSRPDGGVSQPDARAKLATTLDRLAANGVHHVRWFMLADGRAGIRYDEDGTPLGLDDRFCRDVDAALEEARKRGMTIDFALTDFMWFKDHVDMRGDRPRGRADLLRDPAKRQALLDNVITPILKRYGQDPTIAMWDVINEPEWVTFGYGAYDPRAAVAPDEMRAFIGETVKRIHQHTRHPATVGLASGKWLGLATGLNLDVYEVHWYDHLDKGAPLDRPVDALKLDRPLILGEFPTRGSKRSGEAILDTALKAGYGGAMPWAVLSDDAATDFGTVEATLKRWSAEHEEILAR